MTDSCSRHPVAVAAVALLAGGLLASTASAQTQPDDFTPLRAVLNLKLGPAKASDPLRSGKGSMTFEFTGNRCTEYKMVRRTVIDLQFVAGAVKVITDVTMIENADGTQLAFTLTDRVNGEVKRQDTVVAHKTPQGVVVTSRQLPGGRLQLPADVVLPLHHDRLVNAATRNRKPLVATVYNPEESVSSIERTTYRVGDEVKTPLPKGHPAAVLGDAPRYRVELVRYDKTGKLRVRENMTRYAKNLLTVTDAVFVDTRIKADLASLKLLPQKPCP